PRPSRPISPTKRSRSTARSPTGPASPAGTADPTAPVRPTGASPPGGAPVRVPGGGGRPPAPARVGTSALPLPSATAYGREVRAAVSPHRPTRGDRVSTVQSWPDHPSAPPAEEELNALHAWWRAANYLSVGQIYLKDNPLLRRPLER